MGADSDSTSKNKKDGGHEAGGATYGVVYANAPARETFARGAGARFPAGSIIVREKLSKPDDPKPQLLTVMVKRAPGFNPEGGDWEFLTVNGGLTKVTGRQKKGSCLDCHARQRERDFVHTTPDASSDFRVPVGRPDRAPSFTGPAAPPSGFGAPDKKTGF